MRAQVIPVVPERSLDFDNIPGTQEVVLADMVDVLHWRELTLLVRVHQHSLSSGAGTIRITAQPQSWSGEDPGVTFVDTSALLPFLVVIDSNTPSPGYLSKGIQMFGVPAMTAMTRIVAKAERVAAGAMTATVSVDLAAKHI